MYDLLDLYARPFRSGEPVICLDEKSKQLLEDSRVPFILGQSKRCDPTLNFPKWIYSESIWANRA